MTFTAVFTVLGGSYQDSDDPKRETPILMGSITFKLFIVFDCIAFFLSLFVCIMWQMASELTTEDKMLFITVSGLLSCLSFGFKSYNFIAAVYSILERKDSTLAWVISGILLFIALCGTMAFVHHLVMFAVGQARLHLLCGVPRRLDDIVEAVKLMKVTMMRLKGMMMKLPRKKAKRNMNMNMAMATTGPPLHPPTSAILFSNLFSSNSTTLITCRCRFVLY
ncbi:hypothetical protein SUGI_1087860 [Cryptomeria japonica]|nr:hypothetical protein SUGI_1087860 [Cryptomeria japonica]